jgi:catechol 2,3-dioxygenase-like lactoylglutathione lyase family enzyme
VIASGANLVIGRRLPCRKLKEADMSSSEAGSTHASSLGNVDMHLEVDVIPVSDAERAKQFYEGLGWRLDADDAPADSVRIIQFTPPGSACSVTFGEGITKGSPGSAEATLTVTDIEAAHDELLSHGIYASDVWHGAPFPLEARVSGPDPAHTSYGSFCSFDDPDGNAWLVQEVTSRLPGRV